MNIRILCLFLFFCLSASASNFDSLISTKLNVSKPYVLIDIPSSDCINCRSGVSAIIAKLGDRINNNNIFILSDEDGMKLYFSKYKNVYGKYRILIDKNLSTQLMDNGRSKLYVITKSSEKAFDIKSVNDNVIDSIINECSTNEKNTDIKTAKITDSLLDRFGNDYSYYRDNTFLYSSKYQLGVICNSVEQKSEYHEPAISDSMASALYDFIKTIDKRKLLNVQTVKSELDRTTLPLLYIYSFRIINDTCYTLFYINTVMEENVTNDKRNVIIQGRNFVGRLDMKNTKSNYNIFDISNYNDFYLLDTFTRSNKVYYPYLFKGFEIANGDIYLPMRATELNIGVSKEINDLIIMDLKFNENHKFGIAGNYTFDNIKRPDDFSFKIRKNSPVVIDKIRKEIVPFPGKDKISFSAYSNGYDSITYIYDMLFQNDNEATIVGLLNDRETFVGKILLNAPTVNYRKIPLNCFPSNVILNNKIMTAFFKMDNLLQFMFWNME